MFLLHEAMGRKIHLCHLHSHTGEVWNDLADATANFAAAGLLARPVAPDGWVEFLTSPEFRWIWMLPAGVHTRGLPDVADLIVGEAKADVAVGVPTLPRRAASSAAEHVVSVRCATFNACTLTPADDRQIGLYQASVQRLLQAQCCAQGIVVLGIQETRLPSSCQYATEDFLVFNAAAEGGHFGCSLWLSRRSICKVANAGLPGLELRHCTVLVAEPRLLMVRVRATAISWLCVVAHAPHSRRPAPERTAWWDHLETVYCSVRRPEDITLVCIDANARVGSPSSEFVGSHHADVVNANGLALESFLRIADLFLPATTDVHQGSSHTWHSPSGTTARLDFVALPCCMRQSVQTSWIWDCPDVLQQRPDHRAPVLDFTYCRTISCEKGGRSDRLCVDVAQAATWWRAVDSLPPLPWNLSVHEVALTKSLHAQARPFKHARRVIARRPFVGDQVRTAIDMRKHVRHRMHRDCAARNRLWCGWILRAWHAASHPSGDLAGGPDAAFLGEIALYRQVRALDISVAVHWRAFRSLAWEVRGLLKAAKAAYIEELGHSLASAAESFDAGKAYEALKTLVPAIRKRGFITPAVPLQERQGQPFEDGVAKALGLSEHFGGIEGGRLFSWEELRQLHQAHCLSSKRKPSPPLCDLPDRLEWERAWRGLATRKAPGPDGLDVDSLGQALQSVFRLSWPLVLKVASCCTEPLAWRGGDAMALFKGKGSGSQMGQYRSILLSNTMAKRWHSWLRRSLLPTFTAHKAPLQAGAVGGVSTASLSLLLRSFQYHCRLQQLSHALLFVDLRSAFYSVVRQFLLSKPAEQLELADLCQALRLEEWQYEAMAELLSQPRDPAIVAIPSTLQGYLQDLLSVTWFEMKGAPCPVHTLKGSRPGDPLADLLFSFSISAPLKALAADLQTAGLRLSVSCAGILPGIQPGDYWSPATASWHDDLVVMVASQSAGDLLQDCAFAARRVHDLFMARGLQVNYDAGKSELVCSPLGLGAKEVRRKLRAASGCQLVFLPDYGPMQHISCVDAYRHLGSLVHDSANLKVEVQRRLNQARAALKPLCRPLFARRDVTAAAKHNFFRSYVLSRLLHNVGSWSGMQAQDKHTWQAGVLHLYRCMLPRPVVARDAHVTSASLCQYALCPPPLALVRIERLRLAAQLAVSQEIHILALLEAHVGEERCWLSEVLSDVSWARGRVHSRMWDGLPEEPDLAQLFAWLALHASTWPRLLQLLWRATAGQPSVEDFVSHQQSRMVERSCNLCGMLCKGKRGFANHLALQHGLHSHSHSLVRGTVCEGCGVQFHTRSRLLRHVHRYSPRCRRFLLRFCRPLTREESRQADLAERLRKRHSKGVGNLDRVPTVQSQVPCLLLADSGSESEGELRLYDLLLST